MSNSLDGMEKRLDAASTIAGSQALVSALSLVAKGNLAEALVHMFKEGVKCGADFVFEEMVRRNAEQKQSTTSPSDTTSFTA